LAITFTSLIAGQFVYYQNIVLFFVFWLTLGLLGTAWEGGTKTKTFSFKDFPELSLIFNVALASISLLVVFGFYAGLKFYYADVVYAQAEKTTVLSEKRKLIEKSVKFNPWLIHYRVTLTRTYLSEILAGAGQTMSQEDSVFFQQKVSKAIDNAKKATELSQNSVVAWENLAVVYREIRSVAEGALEWGVKAFGQAAELDPTNPVLHTELGKLYLVTSENEKAKQEFEKAIVLKPDYADALIQKSLVYEKENQTAEAIKSLEELADLYPLNVEILFQLGRLYYNNKQTDKSVSVLEKAVRLSPNYSNALYSLGIAYNAQGEKSKAIATLEKVLELNPGNDSLRQKIEELRK